MNFLLEFVSCYGCSRDANNEGSCRDVSSETKALMVDRSARRRKKGRVRLSAGGGTVADWKPTLGVISEDNAVAVLAVTEEGKEKILKRKSGGGGSRDTANRSRYVDYNDRKKNHFVAAAIPAFSPTPFMF